MIKHIKKIAAMYRVKSYVELALLVSLIHVVMPQIRNLSPLRGVLNTDLPDYFKTTTVSTFASTEPAQAGASAGAAAGFGGDFASQSSFGSGEVSFSNAAASSFGNSGGFGFGGGAAEGGFGGGFASQTPAPGISTGSFGSGSGGVSFSNAAASSFGNSGGFGFGGGAAEGGAAEGGFGGGDFANTVPSTPRPIVMSDDDVEEALEFAFSQSATSVGAGIPAASFEENVGFGGFSSPRLERISLSHFGFRRTLPASEMDSNCIGQPLEVASIMLSRRNDLIPADALLTLPNTPLEEDSCLKQQRQKNCPNIISPFLGMLCNPNDQYRTLDGSCNNLRNPEWGASKRRFNRYMQPVYEDGIQKMRGEGRDIPLPSARTVSAELQRISQKPPREDLTLLVMQWGQFLDHDLTHTPSTTRKGQRPILCCEYGIPGFPSDDSCRPIDTTSDPLHREQNRTCMRFVRSSPASKGCSTGSLGPREQQNQLTSYLDASNVYGSDDEEAEGLRTEFGGLLRDSQPPSNGHGTFLPRVNCPEHYSPEAPNNEQNCFEAGDVRVNEQPVLTSMHTLWLRVHNNIATELASLNPSWSDEMLYQETRRIVAALHQQITYREFLPIVHGPDFIREFQLNLQNQGYDNSYNPTVDATIVNVFATAAFRYGHTLIAESFKGMGRNVTLRYNFDEPLVLNDPSTSPSALLQGLTACPTRGADAFLTPTLINHLLSKRGDPIGFDLMALNIQRGRDHGLPPYYEWRRKCGLSQINSFDDLFNIMDPDAARVFQQTYQRVEDIDLFPAGLAENTMPGGLLGPTFSCLLSQQFQALKIGDRFWYENQIQPKPFTLDQLSALREQSLASIMCQHLGLDSLQPMVFRSKHLQGNQLQDCSAFPRLNLGFWIDEVDEDRRVCVGVGVWQQLPGMNQWCMNNCHHIGSQYCPTSHCRCDVDPSSIF